MAAVELAIDPEKVSERCVDALVSALGAELVSVIAHWSWIHGDFEPSRSDVDLLAVTRQDPRTEDVTRLDAELAEMFARNPEWRDRIEIGAITADAIRDVAYETGTPHQCARLSHGESLHLVPAELHRLLDWDAASRGRTIFGEQGVLPDIPPEAVRRTVLQHLANWPKWIESMDGNEPLSYAVLSVARADAYATTGHPHSKRMGGLWLAARSPEYAPLISRAVSIWYRTGPQQPISQDEARSFVLGHVAERMADFGQKA